MNRDLSFVLERLSQPDIEPVTLAEAKRHIRQFVNVTNEDDDIEALIQASREWVEDYTGRCMIDQSWRFAAHPMLIDPSGDIVSGFIRPGYYCGYTSWLSKGGIYLRRSPVLEVTALHTVDAQGSETLVESSQYQLRDKDSKWPRVVPLAGASWNSADFNIEFRAGFADRLGSPIQDASVVPAALKHAMKLIISNYDENRGLVVVGTILNKLPNGIEWLLAGQKCELGFG